MPVVKVIRPDISEEERKRRIDELAMALSTIFHCKVKINEKK